MARFTQVRGISGAGKSTLVRRLFEDYGAEQAGVVELAEGKKPRRVPLWRCRGGLNILGQYTAGSAVGAGGDAMSQEGNVRSALQQCDHLPLVVWESLWGSPEPAREDRFDPKTTWAVLDTPFERCMANIRARRAAKGEDPAKKLNEPKFAAEHRRVANHAAARVQKGMPVVTLNFGDLAYEQLKRLLYFDGWRPAPGVEIPEFEWEAWAALLRRMPGPPAEQTR